MSKKSDRKIAETPVQLPLLKEEEQTVCSRTNVELHQQSTFCYPPLYVIIRLQSYAALTQRVELLIDKIS